MVAYIKNMPGQAVYWGPGTPDGRGGVIDPDPVAVRVRWQTKADLFLNAAGEQAVSEATAYVNTVIASGGHLTQGTLPDPQPADFPNDAATRALRAGAREVRKVDISPSLAGGVELYKAYL